jgi:hypothetical protein
MAGRIAYYGNIVSNGLVLYLDAANKASYPRSGNIWYDLSGYKNNCTLNATNPPVYEDANRWFKFTATSSTRATIPSNSTLNFGTGDFTVLHFSQHPLAGNTTGGCVLFKGARFDANRAGWLVTSHAGTPLYNAISNGSSRIEMALFPNISTFSLGLYGMMRSNGVMYAINNGVLSTGQTNYGSFTGNVDSADDVSVGYNPVYGTFWNGSISNILLYNKALSQQSLTQINNALKIRFGI